MTRTGMTGRCGTGLPPAALRGENRMDERHLNRLYEDMEILEGETLTPEERIRAAADPLTAWYRKNARALPWRESPTPYHVWISEIMLQQTRVAAVLGYYQRFLEALPDIPALAAAEEEQLMKLWEGLGYYSRARNLKKAAAEAVERYGGRLPDSYEELLTLPGIGSYTAGAIASIAYGIAVPAVDGNVLRVTARLLADPEDIGKPTVKKKMERLLGQTMPADRPGEFNQALMELGAMVCVPNGRPHCQECPIKGICLACRRGETDRIPVKAPKKKRKICPMTVFVVTCGNRFLITRRPEQGLLAGLYEFPNTEGTLSGEEALSYLGIRKEEKNAFSMEPLPPAKHIFTHVEWHMTGYHIALSGSDSREAECRAGRLEKRTGGRFVTGREGAEMYAVPGAFQAYMQVAQSLV